MNNSLNKFTHLKDHSPSHLLFLSQTLVFKYINLVSNPVHNKTINQTREPSNLLPFNHLSAFSMRAGYCSR